MAYESMSLSPNCPVANPGHCNGFSDFHLSLAYGLRLSRSCTFQEVNSILRRVCISEGSDSAPQRSGAPPCLPARDLSVQPKVSTKRKKNTRLTIRILSDQTSDLRQMVGVEASMVSRIWLRFLRPGWRGTSRRCDAGLLPGRRWVRSRGR